MNELRKAAEMALEALEDVFDLEKKDVAAIQALRQALAQPKREWVGLTDEEIFLCNEYPVEECCEASIRRAEAKLKEKNT